MHAAKPCVAPCTRLLIPARPAQRSRVSLQRPLRAVPADLLSTVAELSFDSIPQEALLAGGAAAVLGIGAIAFGLQQSGAGAGDASPAAFAAAKQADLPRENAVLVVGATGRTGIQLVQQVLLPLIVLKHT